MDATTFAPPTHTSVSTPATRVPPPSPPTQANPIHTHFRTHFHTLATNQPNQKQPFSSSPSHYRSLCPYVSPECHGRHRLRPAHAQQRVRARYVRRRHRRLGRPGRRHHHLTNSRRPRRHRRHDHRRRKGVASSGGIAARDGHRANGVAGATPRDGNGHIRQGCALGLRESFHAVLLVGGLGLGLGLARLGERGEGGEKG